MLSWQAGRCATQRYWRPDFSEAGAPISQAEATEHLLELLEDAVRIRMKCDAPYGAYLSGGVDSSSVVALMTRFQRHPVKTFCLGYDDPPTGQFAGKQSDLEHARAMAATLGTEHHESRISARQFAERMPEVMQAFDEPFSGTVSTFFMTILIREHVKVALSGDGADELFGSYLAHRLAYPVENYLALARAGKKDWADLSEAERRQLIPFDSPEQFRFLQRIAAEDLAEWRGRLSVFSHRERGELLSPDFLEAAGWPRTEDPYRELASTLTAKDALNRNLEIDQMELLPNQVLPFVDRLSMAHSVEVRCPYLDYRLVEFVNRLPGRLKIKGASCKNIQKEALRGLLPESVLNRPKEGFVQPVYSWMNGELKDWTLSHLRALPASLFRKPATEALLAGVENGDARQGAKVWNLVCFSIWHQLARANGCETPFARSAPC